MLHWTVWEPSIGHMLDVEGLASTLAVLAEQARESAQYLQAAGRAAESMSSEAVTACQDADPDGLDSAGAAAPAGMLSGATGRRVQEILSDLNGLARQRQAADEGARGVLDTVLTVSFPMSPSSGGGSTGSGDDDSRDSGRGSSDEPPVPGPDVPGGDFYDSGLGSPYPGPVSVRWPNPPNWHPKDDDSGEWGSRSPTPVDTASFLAVWAAASSQVDTLPDAALNLIHYLDGTGLTLSQPVDKIITDVPRFADTISGREHDLAAEAVRQAQASGATTPLTFPICTIWFGFDVSKAESPDWYYATGSFDYNLTGQVTVWPPSQPGDSWHYDITTVVNFRDRYNWDANAGKVTEIGGFTITDADMNQLSLAGLAKNYNMVGQSSVRRSQGEI